LVRKHVFINLLVLIETMCSDLDTGPYLKGQGHTRHLKVRVHMCPHYNLLMYWWIII